MGGHNFVPPRDKPAPPAKESFVAALAAKEKKAMKAATAGDVLKALQTAGLVKLGTSPSGALGGGRPYLSPVADALIKESDSAALEFFQIPGLFVEEPKA